VHAPARSLAASRRRSSTRRVGSRLAFVCVVLAGAAGASCKHAPEERTSTSLLRHEPGQLAMRDPDAMRSPGASQRPLGALTPTSSGRATDARRAPEAAPRPAARAKTTVEPPPLLVVSDGATRSDYPLRDGTLSLPGGLLIHGVPRGVAVRTVAEQRTGQTIWEIVDARGRRLALLQAERAGRVALREDPLRRTEDARAERRATWGKQTVQVVSDRFRGETHVYTIDRRATGTAWIWSGLELTR